MRIILVLDLLDGTAVHAIRGEREKYKPIHLFSKVVNSSDPLKIIKRLDPAEVYIADLNRLMKKGSNRNVIKRIREECDIRIMLDYGVRELEDVEEASEMADVVILGTETSSVELIEEASESFDVSVSIDMFEKRVLSVDRRLQMDPLLLMEKINDYDLRDLILLEMSAIGTKKGIDLGFISEAVKITRHPILYGGGIRGYKDVRKLEEVHINGVLVATAVHDGSIPKKFLRADARPTASWNAEATGARSS